MKILRSAQFHPEGVVLTLGNFDGVHRGHRALLTEVAKQAAHLNAQAMALTFDPPPKVYFLKEKYTFITSFADKCVLINAAGISEILVLRFNHALSQLSPQAFVEQYILPLNVKAIILGDDFHFGKNRSGNLDTLVQFGKQHGFQVSHIATQLSDSSRISSSRIRNLLLQGRMHEAADLLGQSPVITGRVIHGEKRGRNFGFPTLNIKVREPLCYSGVFAVTVTGLFDEAVSGVASLGTRPMYDDTPMQLLEVYVFDKNFDAYGKKVCVNVCHKIRDMQKFENEAELIIAMKQDLQNAKFYFGMT